MKKALVIRRGFKLFRLCILLCKIIFFQCSRCNFLNSDTLNDLVKSMEEKELLMKMEPQIQANRKSLPFPRLLAEGILHTDRPLSEKEAVLRELFGIPVEEGQLNLTEIVFS